MRWLAYLVVAVLLPSAALACPSDLSSLVYSGPVTVVACPSGDGESLADLGATVTLTVLDPAGLPVVGLGVSDMVLSEPWGSPETLLHHCDSGVPMARRGLQAESPTGVDGVTTFSGTLAAGGWSDIGLTAKLWCGELTVVAETLVPLEIRVTSPDLNGDGAVNLIDFSIFGGAYATDTWWCDFTRDGAVNLADFSAFGSHYNHGCP